MSDLLGSQQDLGLIVLIETYELSDLGIHWDPFKLLCLKSPHVNFLYY